MKTMTCKQLGGACDKEFTASTFEEIAEMSKQHAKDMYLREDEAHILAMQKMQDMMGKPEAMQEWMDEKKRQFDAL